MKNKVIIFGSIFVIIAGVLFLIFWRSHVMGPGARTTAGGLVAVSADGTPMPPPNSQVMGETIPENTAIQEASDFLVSLKLDPYPPSVSNFNGFEVSLSDSNGQSVSDASVRLDLTMPGMMMPPNQFSLVPVGEGTYQATGPFTMRGPWRIEVIISIGTTTHSVYFDVWL